MLYIVQRQLADRNIKMQGITSLCRQLLLLLGGGQGKGGMLTLSIIDVTHNTRTQIRWTILPAIVSDYSFTNILTHSEIKCKSEAISLAQLRPRAYLPCPLSATFGFSP